MGQAAKRQIGRILLDGRLISKNNLDCALEEQKLTKELLGQVLIRMGILKPKDVKVPLLIQEHLCTIDEAVKIAAGERQLLGALLVHSGHITNDQLDFAIAEQKRSGQRLGEIFIRHGLVTERQLTALLDFQLNQEVAHDSPLRLGELLVATGHITNEQLADALRQQTISHKKIGEVLVDAGYVRPSRIKYGIRLQKKLMVAVLAAILSFGMSTISHATSVALQWAPNTESDLEGYRVYYSTDPAILESGTVVDVHNQTSTTISGLDPDKEYSFAVKAYNSTGVESVLSDTIKVSEQIPPTVAISSPVNGTRISGTVLVTVAAADNVGVAKVEYYINGQLMAAEVSAPYVYSWNTDAVAPGTYSLMAMAYDAAGNVSQSGVSSVSVVNDVIAPTVAVTAPANNAVVSGTVTISAAAADNVGVSMVEIYANGALLFAGNAAPYNFTWDTTAAANGSYTLIAKVYDASGNIGQSSSATVMVNNIQPDVTAPTVSSFIMPATSSSLTVPVSVLVAADQVGVTGYMLTESAVKPYATAAGWSSAPPASFTFSGEGSRTAYAWARDAAGNVSAAKTATVNITLPDVTAPTVSTFIMPATSSSLTVPVSALVAADQVGVTGYLLTESAVKPYATAAGWSSAPPASFTFSGEGSRTAYAWARDAAGNVSAAKTATVNITLPDVTAPTVSSFIMPATSSSLTVPVSVLVAADQVGVTGYMLTESAVKPYATAAGWSATVPASFTFGGEGSRTAYAWARDAAGNVSAAKTAAVNITLPDVTAPQITVFSAKVHYSTVTVIASAQDNVAVAKMELYVDGNLSFVTTASSINKKMNISKGGHEIMVKVYDAANNVASSSTTVVR